MASVNKVMLIENKDKVDSMNERFWSKVNRGRRTECWIWTGAKKPSGYGNIRRNKKYRIAHRVAWEITFGPIPDGMQIQHSCDNPSCCNPHHLMIGTAVSNYVDMVKKGRSRCNHTNRCYGENHPNHKLSSIDVKNIINAYACISSTYRINSTYLD